MPGPQNVPPLDGPHSETDNKPQHDREEHHDKSHHQGPKEMPSSLPGQKIAPDGKKMPMSDEDKKSAQ